MQLIKTPLHQRPYFCLSTGNAERGLHAQNGAYRLAGHRYRKGIECSAMRLLLDRPNLYERCAADDHCRKILEESLRLFTPGDDLAFSDPAT